MAYCGKKISNPFTRQTIEFVVTSKDSDGAWLEMISTWDAHSSKPAPHSHPQQEEHFKVLEGEMHILLNNKTVVLTKGNSLTIKAGTVHAMWNPSGAVAKVSWQVVSALNTEYLLETGFGLATENKVSKNGLPGILQSVLLLRKYHKEFRLSKPSYTVQDILTYILVPFALLAGKKAVYKKYID